MQTCAQLLSAMTNERRVEVDTAFRAACRERPAARTQALHIFVETFEADALSLLAYTALRSGSAAPRKIACEFLATLSLDDILRAMLVAEMLFKKGKSQEAVIAKQWGDGELAGVADRLDAHGPGAPEGEAKVALANIAALGGAAERRQPLFEVFLQHGSATIRAQAIARLAEIGVVAEDPLRGCPLDEKALRGLLSLGARVLPGQGTAPRTPAQWLSACVRWPSGDMHHVHVQGPFQFIGAATIEVRERDNEAFMLFAWHDVHQYHFGIAVEDRSSNPAIHEIDHEGWYPGSAYSTSKPSVPRPR